MDYSLPPSVIDVVDIGLELTSYTVDENDGPIEVCARLVSGDLEKSVEVQLTTSDDSAVSKLHADKQLFIYLLVIFKPLTFSRRLTHAQTGIILTKQYIQHNTLQLNQYMYIYMTLENLTTVPTSHR